MAVISKTVASRNVKEPSGKVVRIIKCTISNNLIARRAKNKKKVQECSEAFSIDQCKLNH